jgi:hypothetical protein
MHLPRELRRRLYYTVPVAGSKVGWSKSESYRQASAGNLPTETDGGLLLVRKRDWDRQVKKVMRRLKAAQAEG